MRSITCGKCNKDLLFADDSGKDELVEFRAVCPCGHENVEHFLGYPKLCGNDEFYFEFIDLAKVQCKHRITYKKRV